MLVLLEASARFDVVNMISLRSKTYGNIVGRFLNYWKQGVVCVCPVHHPITDSNDLSYVALLNKPIAGINLFETNRNTTPFNKHQMKRHGTLQTTLCNNIHN